MFHQERKNSNKLNRNMYNKHVLDDDDSYKPQPCIIDWENIVDFFNIRKISLGFWFKVNKNSFWDPLMETQYYLLYVKKTQA